MKIGIEQRQRTIAGILMTFSALMVVVESRRLEWAVPMASRPERLAPTAAEPANTNSGASLDPTLHDQELKLTENQFYQGTGRNLFRSQSLIHRTRIPPPPVPPAPSLIAPPLVPQITLRFFGFASMSNQPPQAFFGEGDSLFVAKEGDIVNRRYRVLRIDSNSVVLEDMIEKSVHELTLPG